MEMAVFDRHLESMILRQRGQNQALADEIIEKISEANKERLFRIFQDIENDLRAAEHRAKTPWIR